MTRTVLTVSLVSLLYGCGGAANATRDPTTPSSDETRGDTTQQAPVDDSGPIPLGKLPEGVTPLRYALDLHLDPDAPDFSGEVRITTRFDAARSAFYLHGQALRVERVTITPSGGAPIDATYAEVAEPGVSRITASREIPPGEAEVAITYRGNYQRGGDALFLVEAGDAKYLFTQFEPISARLAFPGFDEPRFKTPFDVRITARTAHQVVANTRVLGTEPAEEGMTRTRFATTEPLPTYLLAWGVGPMDVREAVLPPNAVRTTPLPFRAFSVRGRGAELAYTVAHVGAILDALERWTGIPYPYDKLDFLAIRDFPGAMENPGAVTFEEGLLLIEESTASEGQRRDFAGVVAHELAHQWFGDLVTMPWWDDLWLNEAFATWMASKIVQEVQPELGGESDRIEEVRQAFDADSLRAARRIRQPIETHHDIQSAFDSITYSKGGAVLAMIEGYLGPEVFQRGIRAHLGAHRFGTATADDLFASLSTAAGRDLSGLRAFFDTAGVPLVSVSTTCTDGHARISLRQERYAPRGSTIDPAQTWTLPLCVRTDTGRACTLLTEREGTLDLPGACPRWVHPNEGGLGYYRFTMPAAEMTALRTALPRLTLRERASFADAVDTQFSRGELSVDAVLEAARPLAQSTDRVVAIVPMGWLSFLLEEGDDAVRARVQREARAMYTPQYQRLRFGPRGGRRSEDGETRLLRARVISFLALRAEDPIVLREAARRGVQYAGGEDGRLHPEAVDAELVPVALAAAMRSEDAALFDRLLARFRASDESSLRESVLRALGSARSEALATRARALALDPGVRPTEIFSLLNPQAGDRGTRAALWAWVKSEWEALARALPAFILGYVPRLAGGFCTEAERADVEQFIGPRASALPGAPRNLAQTLEDLQLCVALRAAVLPATVR